MKTHFSRDTAIPLWARHRAAGEAWLSSYFDLAEVENGWGVFFVEPYALAISLELFVKALVGIDNPSFNAKDAGHKTAAIIETNTHIPLFSAIAADADLMEVIKEYEKATEFKYGEMGMMIDREEKERVLDAVLRIRDALEARRRPPEPSIEPLS